ncbi:MAG: hypothetical protein NVS3B20_26100 [Polyangiales bacterium]
MKADPAPTRHWIALLGKHQTASLVATVVDFGTMIASVEVLGVTPVTGTVVGATAGAVANFTLGRHWTFRATHARARGQAVRYAIVSAMSLALNAFGVYVFTRRPRLPYVAARLITALAVSIFWNFPLQRYFVFGSQPSPTDRIR